MGDQFALMEAVIALAVLLRRFDFALVPGQDISMTTGATIHTQNGLFMSVKERTTSSSNSSSDAQSVEGQAVAVPV